MTLRVAESGNTNNQHIIFASERQKQRKKPQANQHGAPYMTSIRPSIAAATCSSFPFFFLGPDSSSLKSFGLSHLDLSRLINGTCFFFLFFSTLLARLKTAHGRPEEQQQTIRCCSVRLASFILRSPCSVWATCVAQQFPREDWW